VGGSNINRVMKPKCGEKMGGKCSIHKKRNVYILIRIPEENRTPGGGGLGLDRRIILKCVLKKEDMRMWTYTTG
jgi:hypothetical protein